MKDKVLEVLKESKNPVTLDIIAKAINEGKEFSEAASEYIERRNSFTDKFIKNLRV